MKFRDQLKGLIQLSLVDNELSNYEKNAIYAIGASKNLTEQEIDELFRELLSQKEHKLPDTIPLADDDRLDYLCNVIELMKVDRKVYLSEIRLCEELAVKLGFRKSIVGKLSGMVFNEPGVSSSRLQLQGLIEKYKLGE